MCTYPFVNVLFLEDEVAVAVGPIGSIGPVGSVGPVGPSGPVGPVGPFRVHS